MATATEFAKMVPGFDFLQGLLKNAGAGLPSIGQWVAPTLNPEELAKRIDELRTVQFWLEQNAKLLGTTIQALEVQRMTLSTLKGMNLQMADLRDSLQSRVPGMGAAVAPAAPAAGGSKRSLKGASKTAHRPTGAADKTPAAVATPPLVDPMQWWGALTQQFTELAGKAVREGGGDLARNMAGAMAGAVVQQGMQAASATLKRAAHTAAKAPGQMLKAASDLAHTANTAATAQPVRRKRR